MGDTDIHTYINMGAAFPLFASTLPSIIRKYSLISRHHIYRVSPLDVCLIVNTHTSRHSYSNVGQEKPGIPLKNKRGSLSTHRRLDRFNPTMPKTSLPNRGSARMGESEFWHMGLKSDRDSSTKTGLMAQWQGA